MKILIVSDQTILFRKFIDILSNDYYKFNIINDNITVEFVNAFDAMKSILSFCLSNENQDKTDLTVIVPSDNYFLCDEIYSFLSDDKIVSCPSIILLSTVLTWSNTNIQLISPTKDFYKRRPLHRVYDIYTYENKLWTLAKNKSFNVVILGVGLLYGNNGFDLCSIFNCLWQRNNLNQLSIRQHDDYFVPMIHVLDFVNTIKSIILSIEGNKLRFPIYVPLVDYSKTPFVDILNKLSIAVNNEVPSINISSVNDILSKLTVSSIENYVYDTNINFLNELELDISKKLENEYVDIWNEFIEYNYYMPVRILVIGGPKCGKTTISQKLSYRLNIELVTVTSSILYVLTSSYDNSYYTTEDVNSNSNQNDKNKIITEIIQTKAMLIAAIKLKLMEGKKPKKVDENDNSLDLSTLDLSFNLCSALPSDLLKKCVSIYINSEPKCLRTGYIIDIWEYGLVSPTNTLNDLKFLCCGQMDSMDDIGDYLPELIIELNLSDKSTIGRFTQSLGVTEGSKLSKDIQQQIKTLETQISTYSNNLVWLDESDKTLKCHPILRQFDTTNRILVSRLSTDNSVDVIISSVLDDLFKVHGKVGWTDILNCDSITAIGSQDDLQSTNRSGDNSITLAKSPDHSIFEFISTFDEKDNEILQDNIVELEEYLLSNVLPYLADGMVKIARTKPSDPIDFLMLHLYSTAENVQSSEENDARENFFKKLKEVETNL